MNMTCKIMNYDYDTYVYGLCFPVIRHSFDRVYYSVNRGRFQVRKAEL